ncbi:DUF3466 family protein [Vibrio sp. JC009]|uniref:DUF3466 family protein n=1 Tax=Vibrio sp. JC009 TaxID=2912314 RepID=UPI0023AF3D6A|nr:DUF3466 family protein [Vibrio sp. JC009]WED23170.1 DUF3466 family protein [Vibrio sp. JC009]
MSVKNFKLTTVAAFVLAATNANAALYQVVESDASSLTTAGDYYSSAIQGAGSSPTSCFDSGSGCSGSSYNLAGDTLNAGQSTSMSSKLTYRAIEGISYKEEVPFGIDSDYDILTQDDLETYCNAYLGYSTCDSWATWHWSGDTDTGIGGLEKERNAFSDKDYSTNADSFFEAFTSSIFPFDPDEGSSAPSSGISSAPTSGTTEQVVTNIMTDTSGTLVGVTGITNSGYYTTTDGNSNYAQLYRQRGFFTNSDGSSITVLEPDYDSSVTSDSSKDSTIVNQMGRTMAFDSFSYGGTRYIVGSASVAPFSYSYDDKDYTGDVGACVDYTDPALYQDCQNFAFANRAYIWDSSNTSNKYYVADWDLDSATTALDDDTAAQASVRAATIADVSTSAYDGLPVLVGYNTDEYSSAFYMQAAVFRPASTSSFAIDGNEKWTSTFIENAKATSGTYRNSVATDINDNLLVIGEAKLKTPENGAYANKMFIADATSTPTAVYFNDMSEDIFFTGAGGQANAINNYNEIVGSVDAENHSESGGKARDIRGFIYPYSHTRGTETTRRAIFSNKAWWLDDLTNGGTYSDNNNKYRIIDATDINDAGVISATALKCSSGYDSTDHFAYCGGGSTQERIVAVKLVPIAGATSSDISARSTSSSTTVSRSGGSLGWFSIGLLGLLGFRRRK